jgi:putative nucleotidyltransferase with HDIG domain
MKRRFAWSDDTATVRNCVIGLARMIGKVNPPVPSYDKDEGSMSDSAAQRSQMILQQLESLPTLPMVALRVLELTSQSRTSARDVVTVIESDPALTTRILRIVHRADGGIRGEINSIERAVVLLGFDAVRNASLAVGVFETFGPHAERGIRPGKFSREEFWKHCLAVACVAELLAEQTPKSARVDPSEAFVAGLLHDIGKVAIDAALPKSFARVVDAAEMLRADIADVERNVIGMDHMVIGKRLAERWMLPAVLRDAIWLHNQSPEALPPNLKNPRLVNIVTLADAAARHAHIGYSGNYTYAIQAASLLDALGLTPAQLDAAQAGLVTRLEPRAKALGLGESSSDDIYRQALVRANAELTRVTDQLATKNRKLGVRAKFFETLASFHDELRPDSPPSAVLYAIAQTATGALDLDAAAAFSVGLGADGLESMVVDRAGEVAQRGLIVPDSDHPFDPRAIEVPAGDGPVHGVDESLEWIAQTLAPRLGGTRCFWIPLVADSACIGGLVWGATGDERSRLGPQSGELSALAAGWALALRTCQIRDEARVVSEQLADANRRLISAQDEVARARTITSIAEIAAGAAHEMNNPLAVIGGRAQLLARVLSDPRFSQLDAKLGSHAQQIAENAERLSGIITELMHYAKPTAPQPQSCDVALALATAVRQAKERAELVDRHMETSGLDVPAVWADPRQLEAAIAEVVINAIQATDASTGRIEIRATHDRYGQKVVVTIEDNGGGMDEATASRAFDPFYSSMPAGRRRGMGLPKALRWIEASGGSLKLDSTPGEGTRAVIVLKVADNAHAALAPVASA